MHKITSGISPPWPTRVA